MEKVVFSKKVLIRNFLIKAAIFYIGWTILFHGFILPSGSFNNFLTLSVAKGTKLGGQFLGYNSEVVIQRDEKIVSRIKAIVYMDGEPAVLVADGCNGLELFALFVGFIICFPGPGLPKLIFSTVGTMILFLINIIREITLAFNYLYFRSSFNFNHHYTYAIVVYAIVFMIWRYWLNNHSALSSSNK